MKVRFFSYTLWLLLSSILLPWVPAHAGAEGQAEASPRRKKTSGKRKQESELPAVPAALKQFKVHNAKVNTKAGVYFYLYSASWCGYCQQCMPIAVEQYKKMRIGRKAEIIVIGGDKTEKEAVQYLKSYKLKVPGIMFDELKATKFRGLPGCGFFGFPAISVVTKDGRMLKNVIGAAQVKEVLTNWQQFLQDN